MFGNRIDLDKDILKSGNKEYSPETCVLIEHYINTIFERHASDNIYENEDGKYFVGSNKKKYMRHMMKCLNSLVIKRKSV